MLFYKIKIVWLVLLINITCATSTNAGVKKMKIQDEEKTIFSLNRHNINQAIKEVNEYIATAEESYKEKAFELLNKVKEETEHSKLINY